MAQLPSSGDDATPFLLRVYVKLAPFRPLTDFEARSRVIGDEFKLHIWRTNTLRDVAQMLSEADPSLSTPLALHTFRSVYYDRTRPGYLATSIGAGITRTPLQSIQILLSDIDTLSDLSSSADKIESADSNPAITRLCGLEDLRPHIDEIAATTTLAQLDLTPDHFLDCIITPDPTLTARKPNDRSHSIPSHSFSRR